MDKKIRRNLTQKDLQTKRETHTERKPLDEQTKRRTNQRDNAPKDKQTNIQEMNEPAQTEQNLNGAQTERVEIENVLERNENWNKIVKRSEIFLWLLFLRK